VAHSSNGLKDFQQLVNIYSCSIHAVQYEYELNIVIGVEGNDVVQLLNDAFKRKGISARVVALANDTVGTMMTR
jgi:hypothetical protein